MAPRRITLLATATALLACSSADPAPATPAAGATAPPVLAAGSGGGGGAAAGGRAARAGSGGTSASVGGVAGKAAAAGRAGEGVAGAANGGGMGGAGAAAGSVAAGSGGSAGAGPAADSCEPDDLEKNPPKQLSLTGNLGTHDPSMIEANGAYFEFQTGPGLPIKRSTDLLAWDAKGSVFSKNPAWIAEKVSGAGDLWAPDISYFGGAYHVYYAASTPGSNHSCIGHATSPAPDGTWTDLGSVICSNAGSAKDDWNAIDPNFIADEAGHGFLVFGSFWGGLKLIELDDKGARANDKLVAVAARPKNGGALEAPFIVHRCGFYYLFVSFDKCCDGANSTYNVRVGRSTEIAGPYADKAGVAMLQGGGTLLVSMNDTWHGPGHSAVITTKGRSYDVHHAYYAGTNTNAYRKDGSYLRISELAWGADGWPVSGGP